MKDKLSAHADAMRKLLKALGSGQPVSIDALKLIESHAKAARLLHEAAEALSPFEHAVPPPAPNRVPRSLNAMTRAYEWTIWRQARDTAEADLKRAVKRSEKLLTRSEVTEVTEAADKC